MRWGAFSFMNAAPSAFGTKTIAFTINTYGVPHE